MIAAAPGLALAVAIAALALGLTKLIGVPGSSPLIFAVALGLLVRALIGVPAVVKAGLAIAVKQGLRIGVALLGFQLTLGQLGAIGGRGASIAIVALLATFTFTRWLGRLMGVDNQLAQLLAAGTSICGASAIVGANAITRASDEDVSYAVATVTVMGLVLMIVYPRLSTWLQLSAPDYGIWVGSSIHEVAQVVAAGFQRGAAAGQIATAVKLTRVALLAPALFFAWYLGRRQEAKGASGLRTSPPWFVIAFVLAAAANSFELVPREARSALVATVPFMLTIGLAAVGLDTDARVLVNRGYRPLLLAFIATLFIALSSLALIAVSS